MSPKMSRILKGQDIRVKLLCDTGRQNRSPVLGVGTSGRGEDVGKGCRRVNMVQILCTRL
jgi:hypothetical protein